MSARKLADGYAQSAQTCRACASGIVNACGPGSPDSHRVVWGLTSRPPVPLRAFLRFPVCPPGSPPSPAFPWFPFVRRSPVRSLRPLPGFRFPFGLPPVSLPVGNLHDSAAGGRFRRRWSRAAKAKVTSPATAALCLDLAVIRPALQMGNGWHEAMSLHNRLLRAAASPGRRCARTDPIRRFSGASATPGSHVR